MKVSGSITNQIYAVLRNYKTTYSDHCIKEGMNADDIEEFWCKDRRRNSLLAAIAEFDCMSNMQNLEMTFKERTSLREAGDVT
jgi:ribosome-interacting GTPase 1